MGKKVEVAGTKPNRHHPVTKLKLPKRPVQKKGRAGKRVLFIREVINEVTGINNYEKKIVELIKSNQNSKALKVAKKILGTHKRGLRKRNNLVNLLREKKIK
jgi:large subunit ribosomal protein L36e